MAFTISDYDDLVRLLEEHPEWRTDLRRLLLADDILELPRIVRELAEAQKRTEARLESLEAVVRELVETQKNANERMERLETVVQYLAETQARTETAVGDLKGWLLEEKYRDRAFAYFGRLLRKAHAVPLEELTAAVEAYERGELSPEEWNELAVLDVCIQGRAGKGADAKDVWLAVEVSWVIDMNDVRRAYQRAKLLRRLGYNAFPAVGGDSILGDAERDVRASGVLMLLQGRLRFVPDALAALLASGDGGGPARE